MPDKGRARVENTQALLYASIGKERADEFIAISWEICNATEKPNFSE